MEKARGRLKPLNGVEKMLVHWSCLEVEQLPPTAPQAQPGRWGTDLKFAFSLVEQKFSNQIIISSTSTCNRPLHT